MRAAALVLCSMVTTPPLVGAQGAEQRAAPPELRELYFAAVEQEEAIAEGLELVERIELREAPGAVDPALLQAYRGALVTLRAKHGFWPPARLRNLERGLDLLDAAVERRPDQVEIRYLRLLSCYYLPGLFGRGGSVRDDFDALARLLPEAAGAYPADLYRTMVRFVLENGRLDEEQAAPLRQVLAARRDE